MRLKIVDALRRSEGDADVSLAANRLGESAPPQAAPGVHVHFDPAGVPDVRHARCAAHQPVAGHQHGRRGPAADAEQGEHDGAAATLALREDQGGAKGVRAVAPFNWFGGMYKDAQAPDPDAGDGSRAVPGGVSGDEAEARGDRGVEAAIARESSSGKLLADQYGWKVGRPRFRSARRSGASPTARDTWEFNIVGIYRRRRWWREQEPARSSSTTISTSRCSSARTRPA